MFDKFEWHVNRKRFFSPDTKYLLAFSSGVDSVVLAHLLIKYGVNFSIAHCNFNLREKDSQEDADFAKQFAEQKNIPFHYQSFDTIAHLKLNHSSVQITARKLRYTWFRELVQEKAYSKVLTAHHASDNVETFLINALRGSGIKGFKGISEQTTELLRPLLCFTKNEILEYATANKLHYRDDKSNYQIKYERNYLRSKIVPLLKNINPSLENTFYANSRHLEESINMANEYIETRVKEIVKHEADDIIIDKQQVLDEKYKSSIVFAILHPFGYNGHQLEQLLEAIQQPNNSGKTFLSSTHITLIDRLTIIIRPQKKEAVVDKHYFHSLEELKRFPELSLYIEGTTHFDFSNANQLAIDLERLLFPLCIRKKQTGDKFMPFGMKQFKKLSDFFINSKLTEFEKEQVWILENGNGDIIWVMGYRSDERYRIRGNELHLYKMELR
jgi:tRNA(Ile)-lysidine synthase